MNLLPLHLASAFTSDGRPLFPAHMRDLPRSIILDASFAIAIGGRIEDRRAPHETTVAGCEGTSCELVPAKAGIKAAGDG